LAGSAFSFLPAVGLFLASVLFFAGDVFFASVLAAAFGA